MKYSSEKQIAELVVYTKTDVLIKKNCLEATLPCLHTSSFKHKTFQVLLALICRKKVLVKFENEEVHYNFFVIVTISRWLSTTACLNCYIFKTIHTYLCVENLVVYPLFPSFTNHFIVKNNTIHFGSYSSTFISSMKNSDTLNREKGLLPEMYTCTYLYEQQRPHHYF